MRLRRSGTEDAAGARALWEERNWPLQSIDQVRESASRGPLSLLERAGAEVDRLFLAPRRGAGSLLSPAEAREARALAAIRGALAELRELARSSPQLAPSSARELAAELERVEVVSGERPGPGLVAVLDPLQLRARRVRALLLVGLCEGIFPAPARPQALISDEERLRVAQASGLMLGESREQLAAERYLLYAALSRPQELLVLSWHDADDDGEPVSRSLFVDDILDLFDRGLSGTALRRPLGTADAASADPAMPRPLGPLVDESLLGELRGHVWSASSLQLWTACPVRWFVERMLRPGQLDPEAEPLARGALAHAALRDTLAGLCLETGSARLTPRSLPRARELLAQALEENEERHQLSVAPERRPGFRRRLRADLDRYLQHAAEQESPLEPARLELGFGSAPGGEPGEEGEQELPAVDLGGGVLMRGRIDRVDEDGAGRAVVYDYKASSAPPVARWLGEGNLQVALYMHAVSEPAGPGGRGRLLPAAVGRRSACARRAGLRKRPRHRRDEERPARARRGARAAPRVPGRGTARRGRGRRGRARAASRHVRLSRRGVHVSDDLPV